MKLGKKVAFGLVWLVLCIALLSPVFAAEEGEQMGGMEMGAGAAASSEENSGMKMEEGAAGAATEEHAGMKMEEGAAAASGTAHTDEHSEHSMGSGTAFGLGTTAQNVINQVTYLIAPLLALFVLSVSIMLIRATGQTDKFALISIGLGFLALQGILNFVFWVSEGSALNMPATMLQIGILNVLTLSFIGAAFYRWRKMVKAL